MPVQNFANISSTDDIMQEIFTFLTATIGANAWTGNGINLTTNVAGLSTGNLFVQFSWGSASIDISQSTASGATAVFNGEAGDSNFLSQVDFPAVVSNAEMWLFYDDTATAADRGCRVVIEFNRDGRFMHFGFGQVPESLKTFSWVGGAFKYGAEFNVITNGHQPWSVAHRGPLLDTLHTSTNPSTTGNLHTMRAEGLRRQHVDSKWLAFTSGIIATIEAVNDSDGDPMTVGRAFGRYGPYIASTSAQRGSPNSATVNFAPILITMAKDTRLYMPLGTMPGVRICNLGNIQPKEQKTIGSNTWQFFPWGQKLTLTSDVDIVATRNLGIAYLVS